MSSGSSISESRSSKVPVIGILGGVGSGKSSIVRRVSDGRLVIFDADKIGHDLLSDNDVRNQIRSSFGEDVFDNQNNVNRKQLAQLVFGATEVHQARLKKLEQILHPAIRQEIVRQIQNVSTDVDAIILDAALLLEAGWAAECDKLIFVDTPLAIREARVIRDRGWTPDELARREAAQWSVDAKREQADFVVDNSGTIEAATADMTRVLKSIIVEFHQNQRTC